MHRISAAAAVALAAVLLAGCGSGDGDEAQDDKGSTAGAQKSGGSGDTGAAVDEGTSGQASETRKVTLEVGGEGETQVYWTIGTNKSETVSLPWTKTKELTLEGAQLEVGALVSVVPGSVKDEAGRYVPAPCVITVDGAKVADNDEGKSETGCKYTVK